MLPSLLGLLAPVSCAGCFRPDTALCARCARRLCGPVSAPRLAVATALWGVPVISGGPFRGARRRVIVAIKDGGFRKISGALVTPALAGALGRLLAENPGVVLVPVPPSARGFFLRGFWPTVLIAEALSERSGRLPVRRVLSLGLPLMGGETLFGPTRTRSRTRRLARRWSGVRVGVLPPHSRVVLVDDVMVTGATLEACARALKRAGHTIIGVVVAAHVPEKEKTLFPRTGGQVYSERTTLTRRT